MSLPVGYRSFTAPRHKTLLRFAGRGAAKESNWLPAPNDTINLVMRLYRPKTESAFHSASRRWDMEATGHCEGELIGFRKRAGRRVIL
jgi:hypothetical protein